ncbi:hypothetical protein AB0F81_51085 [Actinoplanes sp. NPDC024001]|uniref:DUF6197 family protein n=1 Tax=Actinoplanes sp. NPDC024001 TaxID=3154598 RepID=UPI0033F4D06F
MQRASIQQRPARFAGETAVPPRHEDALAVLAAARTVVEHGWVQHRWYTLQAAPGGRRRRFGGIVPLARPDHSRVVEACLVGAVVHAAWQQSPRPEHANPAIDALWRTLFDPEPADADAVGPVSSPPVRAARVRDLTTWNDRRSRTRSDVLDLIERTAARVAGARPADVA